MDPPRNRVYSFSNFRTTEWGGLDHCSNVASPLCIHGKDKESAMLNTEEEGSRFLTSSVKKDLTIFISSTFSSKFNVCEVARLVRESTPQSPSFSSLFHYHPITFPVLLCWSFTLPIIPREYRRDQF